MIKASAEFQNAHGKAYHPLSYERIIETRAEAKQKLLNFLIDSRNIFSDVKSSPGPDKSLETAKDKADRDYFGDRRQVTDFIRSKAQVTSPETISQLKSRDFEHLLHKHGIQVAEMNDYFDDPKDQTGYRCLNYKLAIPVGESRNLNREYHIVELQVVAEQIEEVYDDTHEYKRRAEDAHTEIARLKKQGSIHELLDKEENNENLNHDQLIRLEKFRAEVAQLTTIGTENPSREDLIEFEQLKKQGGIYELLDKEENDEELNIGEKIRLKRFRMESKPLRTIANSNYAACRLINGRAARGPDPDDLTRNYENLIRPDLKPKHFLFPGREEHLESQKDKADNMVYE